MVVERGQIYWCGLDPIHGHEQGATRPVVVVSSDSYNRAKSPMTGVVPLTRAAPKNPIHLLLPASETGLESDSTALTDHARFIDKGRLKGSPIGKVQPAALALLNRQLGRVLGI